jgi:hypothetical protein
MRRTAWLAGLAVLLFGATAARGSGALGVIAVIDKVVSEPSGEAPERIRVWGTFVFAREEAGKATDYGLPAYGFLYYTSAAGKETECRREWEEMRKAAGTGSVIGWADSSLGIPLGKVRRPGAPAGEPDPYPLGFGLLKFARESTSAPVRSLRTIPAPISPVDEAVAAGKVKLVVHNVRDTARAKAAYWFVVESAAGEREVSDPVPAGEKETTWTPRLEVKAGEKYTWRVQAVEGDWKGPANTATFKGKAGS